MTQTQIDKASDIDRAWIFAAWTGSMCAQGYLAAHTGTPKTGWTWPGGGFAADEIYAVQREPDGAGMLAPTSPLDSSGTKNSFRRKKGSTNGEL